VATSDTNVFSSIFDDGFGSRSAGGSAIASVTIRLIFSSIVRSPLRARFEVRDANQTSANARLVATLGLAAR